MRVRLTRKLAESVDGVDLSHAHAGDVLNLPRSKAALLLAEGWAEPVAERRHTHGENLSMHAQAADGPRRARRTAARLREGRQQTEAQSLPEQHHRRAEDRIREELRDSRAKTIKK